jgi:RNA polymerase sigma-70 factor (ECF subfamily)
VITAITEKSNINKTQVPFIGDDEALLVALKANQAGSKEVLFERYAGHVRGVIVKTLGTNVDLQDHLHNVFIEAFQSIGGLRDGKKLKSWLTSVTIYTVIAYIRKKKRKKWLIFLPSDELPEQVVETDNGENSRVLKQVYEVLEEMSANDRIAFSLRIIDGMTLMDVAQACNVSLATIKRRLNKAKQRFNVLAKKYPLLVEFMNSNGFGRN